VGVKCSTKLPEFTTVFASSLMCLFCFHHPHRWLNMITAHKETVPTMTYISLLLLS
jgi:hypothetical protein